VPDGRTSWSRTSSWTRARRAGVGRTPLAAARAHGEAAGCFEVQLSADDPDAFTCYEAAGLRPAARTYQQYLPADRR
jgi:hypothetical protein